MNANALLALLNDSDELENLEVKRGGRIGDSVMETVCAFANTPDLGGGTLILSVERRDADGSLFPYYEVVGVPDPDKLQSDLAWLSRLAEHQLVASQQQAIVFVREVGAIDHLRYRQLTGQSPAEARTEIKALVNADVLQQKGKGRGTYYVQGKALVDSWATFRAEHPDALITEGGDHNTEPRPTITEAGGYNTEPRPTITEAEGHNTEPQSAITEPQSVITEAGNTVITEPPGVITEPLGAAITEPLGAVIPVPLGAVIPEPLGAVIPEPPAAVIPEPLGAVIPEPPAAVIPEPPAALIPEPLGAVIPEPPAAVIPEPPHRGVGPSDFELKVLTIDSAPVGRKIRTEINTLKKRTLQAEKVNVLLVELCQSPRSLVSLAKLLGRTEDHIFRHYLKPLLDAGRLTRLFPDLPNHPNQAYVTPKGPQA